MTEGGGLDRAESPPRGYQVSGGLVPIPDPTLLTTQSLQREISSLKELIAVELKSLDHRIVELSSYSKARGEDIKSAAQILQNLLEEKINKNADVSEERFKAIGAQFTLNGTALTAAFAANKELNDSQMKANAASIAKQEGAFSEALKQLQVISQTENKAIKEQIDDLKESMTLVRGAHSGAKDFWGYVIGAIGLLVAIGTLAVLVVSRTH